MNAYQDTVLNTALLANPSVEGRLVEVIGDKSLLLITTTLSLKQKVLFGKRLLILQ